MGTCCSICQALMGHITEELRRYIMCLVALRQDTVENVIPVGLCIGGVR